MSPRQLNVGSWIDYKALTVKSGVDVQHKIFGSTFWLKSTGGALFLQINDTAEKIPIPANFYFRLRGNDMFECLTFSQSTGSDINIEFYAGNADFGYFV